MSRKLLATTGAILLVIGGAMHSFGWTFVGPMFAGKMAAFSRMLWFQPVIDWLVVAVIWVLGARGHASVAVMRVSAIIPATMAIGALILMGPTFIGAWVLILATAAGLASTFVPARA